MTHALDRVCVVIPAYNEAAVIADVIGDVRRLFDHVVCIDDGSLDETSVKAREAGAVVVRHPLNRGQGAALQTGLEWALQQQSFEAIVTFDADGQHRPEDAARMATFLIERGLDVVLGSRFAGAAYDMPRLKRLLLKAATVYTRITSGIPVTDTHNGLRALSPRGAAAMKFNHRGMAHASEVLQLISANRLSWAEYPVEVRYTEHSLAKGQSLWNSVNILWDLTWKKHP